MSVVTASSNVLDAGSSPAISTSTPPVKKSGRSVSSRACLFFVPARTSFVIGRISPIRRIWLPIYWRVKKKMTDIRHRESRLVGTWRSIFCSFCCFRMDCHVAPLLSMNNNVTRSIIKRTGTRPVPTVVNGTGCQDIHVHCPCAVSCRIRVARNDGEYT